MKITHISAQILILAATAAAYPQSQADCAFGEHWVAGNDESYPSCQSNNHGCSVFNEAGGYCEECDSIYNQKEDSIAGNHCTMKWWVILLFVFGGIVFCYCMCGGLCQIMKSCKEKCGEVSFKNCFKKKKTPIIQTQPENFNNEQRANSIQNSSSYLPALPPLPAPPPPVQFNQFGQPQPVFNNNSDFNFGADDESLNENPNQNAIQGIPMVGTESLKKSSSWIHEIKIPNSMGQSGLGGMNNNNIQLTDDAVQPYRINPNLVGQVDPYTQPMPVPGYQQPPQNQQNNYFGTTPNCPVNNNPPPFNPYAKNDIQLTDDAPPPYSPNAYYPPIPQYPQNPQTNVGYPIAMPPPQLPTLGGYQQQQQGPVMPDAYNNNINLED